MKTRKSLVFKSLAALAVLAAGATCAWTYTLQYNLNMHSLGGYFQKWDPNAKITMAYNLTFPQQFSSSNPNPALVQAVLRNDMLNIWNGVLKSNNIAVQFADGGTNSSVANVACDGVNIITFSNSSKSQPPPPSGVLALTYVFAVETSGVIPAGTCGSNAITTTFPGQIFEADITFSTTVPFSVDGLYVGGSSTNQASDIEGTALHEMGHVLGLHHSTMNSALMIAAAQQVFPNRSLSSDDIAGINAAYGVNNLGGSISGTVADGSGTPVLGAAVQLTNSTTGVPTVAGITDATGAFSMVGFPAGTYNVWVKPLDIYPTMPGNFTPEYSAAPGTAFNAFALGSPAVVTGKANLVLPPIQATAPYAATFDDIVVQTTVGNSVGAFGGVVASARRAGSGSAYPSNTGAYGICAFGFGFTGEITTSVPTAVPNGSTAPSTCNVGAVLARNFTFPANTVPGWYDVNTGNDIMPSSLQITTNPFVGNGGIIDSAANTKTYAAGAFISIYGLDLTTQTIGNTVFPVPTQLGGISVRVGDRFAPLFFVSPGQINAMIPYEAASCSTGATTGCAVDVQVLVGNNSIFDYGTNYGTINVVASAPKIFTINSSGTGQGAIQDGSAPGTPIADVNNPASAGHVLVIYASGLGQTTPAAIDGLAGTGTTAAATVTLSVNGKTISVPVVYTGVTSCCSALYQINAQLPSPTGLDGSNGAQLQVTDSLGNKSNIVTVAIK